MKTSRVWAMPRAETFDIEPIGALLDRVLAGCAVVVDPFARNATRGTITNDLNPTTNAHYNMDALDFVEMLSRKGIKADAVLFDPPYSPRQIAEVYQRIGRRATQEDTQNARLSNRGANARLIAAAPDLLAALKAVEAASQDDMPPEVESAIQRRVSEAIAKAEGRSL